MTKRFLFLLIAGLISISACSSPENVSQESGGEDADGIFNITIEHSGGCDQYQGIVSVDMNLKKIYDQVIACP